GAGHFHAFVGHERQGLFQGRLHAGAVAEALPAEEVGAVVLDTEGEAHDQSIAENNNGGNLEKTIPAPSVPFVQDAAQTTHDAFSCTQCTLRETRRECGAKRVRDFSGFPACAWKCQASSSSSFCATSFCSCVPSCRASVSIARAPSW